jgi:uncharacterized phage protein (TIGR01671 family)
MREIKFRAWDKKNKVMIYDFSYYCKLGENYAIYDFDTDVDECISDDVELMQFTGLKDKNGKEIYEGDIMRNSQLLREWTLEKVEFGKILDPDWEEYTYGYFDYTDGEVIGNIHENPELLKENKK